MCKEIVYTPPDSGGVGPSLIRGSIGPQRLSAIGQTEPRDPHGKNQHESGAKLDAGKIQPSLIFEGFANALTAVAEVGTYGANKYTRDGWATVSDGIYRYKNAAHRHALKRNTEGEFDHESKLRHLAHQAWNILAELELLIREGKKNA